MPFPSHAYIRHAFEPLHGVPMGAGGLEHTPLIGLHVPARWQPSLAAHVTETVPVQTPLAQAYVSHLLDPVHGVPSGWSVCGEQVPVPAEHVPGTWHESVAVHDTELMPVQTPAMQAYESHLFEPVHAVPSGSWVCAEHVPVLGLHVPGAWHASVAGGQLTGLEPVHTPARHEYVWSHLFVPVQAEPHAPQLPSSVLMFTQAVPQRFGKAALGQVATQLLPLQASVPLSGCTGQFTHAPPQCIVPGGQMVHAPPLQRLPLAGQTFPQLPQLFTSVDVSTSHPLAVL